MAKITPESIADLKALFQDNEKALGANFSQLIDFFNDNKVTDNGDGTYSVDGKTLTPADDAKVVHTADMRKPASDVAGIEEVNAKQDKLTITPADDSKVVHTSDMRKPASDVAGIEEVNALQTQVDNSAVGTNLLTNTGDLSANWYGATLISTTTEYNGHPSMGFTSSTKQLGAQKLGLGELKNSTQYTASFWAKADNAGDKAHTELWGSIGNTDFVLTTNWVRYTAVLTSYSDANTNADHFGCFFGVPVGNTGTIYIALPKLELGSHATDWCPNPEDKVNVSDMRKPASDVVGLEDVSTVVNQGQVASNTDIHTIKTEGVYTLASTYVNAPFTAGIYGMLQVISKGTVIFHIIYAHNCVYVEELGGAPASWSNWAQLSDDSKVAHLSGANNFDTIPTVNNNPLLLASSLPSDLARTGQANTFSKQQIFSTNPTNGTQVYPIYATVGTDADATTLIASLQSSGFSGMIGVPES